MTTMHVLHVSQVTYYLRQLLESDVILGDLWVQGEISNCKRAASGHYYFTLKDDSAALDVAMWRSYASRLNAPLTNGEAVLAHGRVSLYEASGRLQLYADLIQPAGVGLLHARFEELKLRLESEGLFDPGRKRALPPLPRRIGIATSAQAAALQDMLTVLARRYPLADVVLAPCLVQGERAPASIKAALERLYTSQVDLILLARGGGSMEDLWSFNEELVARAVFASPVPVITGVGHETDTTIVDYVADLRAPTPSAAAELAVPDVLTLHESVAALRTQLDITMQQRLATLCQQVQQQQDRLQQQHPAAQLARARQQIDDLQQQATRHARATVERQRVQLAHLHGQVQALSPQATLERGYALVQRADDARLLTDPQHASPGDHLRLTLRGGTLNAVVLPPNEHESP